MLIGCCVYSQQPTAFHEQILTGFTQGTTYNIKYYSTKQVLKSEIDSVLNSIDLSMSTYRKDSRISIFNGVETNCIEMDKHMQCVIRESFKTYERTNGYFDITIKPLVDLWGFGPKGFTKKPSSEEITRAISKVGMKTNLKQKGKYLIKKKEGVSIDLNGIAQGYSVDVIGNYFLSKNIRNFIIEIGGEIVTKGSKPNGDFLIMIQRPSFPGKNIEPYKVRLRNKAITTSGTYENTVRINGKSVSHHIDPKTGYPIENKTLSATIIANTALEADALDNYLMFLEPLKAVEFAEKNKSIEIYLIYVEDNILKEAQSSGFHNYIVHN